VLGVVRGLELRRSHEATLDLAAARAANLSRILSEYITEAFGSGDAALRQLALHSQRIGGPGAPAVDWTPSLASARAGLTGIGAITVVDAGGTIRHSTRPEIIGESRAADPTVRDALRSREDTLVAGAPFRTIAGDRPFIIPIGRRLTNVSGETTGAVVASFVPENARQFFRSLDLGEHGAIWVFHPDGVVMFHEPSAANAIGTPAPQHPLLAAARRDGEGLLRAPLDEGGPVMLSAFQTMTAPSLVVAVSLDRDEVLGAWYREAATAAAGFGAIAVMLGVILVLLYRQTDAMTAALERERGARRDAEAASALKDQFLMTVSHELRTPLTAIHGWARMLTQGTVSDRQRDNAIRTIERNAQAQTRLIEDLLDMSRVTTGQLRLDVRPVHVADVVAAAVETVRPAAEAKSIQLQTVIDLTPGAINGDAERLQQVVWNLLANAVKFTPNGGRVLVTVARVAREIEIVVADNGRGIAPEFLPHVFERFRQEDSGTKRTIGGLGLGLAIVRHLVEMHGGTITAQSNGQGHGATFTVRLPSQVRDTLAVARQAAIALVLAGSLAASASAAELLVMSAGAVESGLMPLVEQFQRDSGHTVRVQINTSPQLTVRLTAGERADVLIAPVAVMDRAVARGAVARDTRMTIGRVGAGVIVRAGVPAPDVSSREALRRALLAADAVVYNTASTGTYLESLFAQMGVADAVKAKAVRVTTGEEVMERIIGGRGRELGFGALTVIRVYESKGVRYAGGLPDAVQNFTTYDAAVMTGAADTAAAGNLVRFLTSAAARQQFAAVGVE
jgi:signal transduction histidine kinase/ABC-type molybdate transport system substrate-binding protein